MIATIDQRGPAMPNRLTLAGKVLPVSAAIAGLLMTGVAAKLLIDAAGLGILVKRMMGFMGVICFNSVVLSIVAIRIALRKDDEITQPERIFLFGLSLCMGASLTVINFLDL